MSASPKISSFTIIVTFLCVALAGIAFIPLLPIKLSPSRTLPQLTISYNMPGNSARVIEMEVTSRLEAMLARIKGIKEINSTSTYRQSKTTQLNLRQFIESRGMKDIAFSDITEEFAESFKVFLKKELGHRNGHVNHCLCWLNRLIYIAVDREILRANPIEDVAYERKETPKLRHISRSELKRMMETPLPDPMMELARRTFIFSSLTGLAYADTRALHPRHIGTTSEGRRYIRIRRAKTDVEAFIPLHPIAGQILELYNTTDDDRPVFPLPVRDVLWYEVHGMGVALGMKENLSYHMARHSFGTLTLTAGIPIESIARMMGHTNIDSTQVYAQVTDRKISSDMNRLMERRKPAAGKEAAG